MEIISRICPFGPMQSKECFAVFGVEYQTYLWLLLAALILGFSSCFIYLRIKNKKFENRKYLIKSLLISLIIFIICSIWSILGQARRIY